MSKVLWIDDSPKALSHMIEPVVKKLWDKNIKSDMYIVGDFEKENSHINNSVFCQSVEQLNENISIQFVNYLIEKDMLGNSAKSHKKYHLIHENYKEDPSCISIPKSTIARTEFNNIHISETFIESWEKLDEGIFVSDGKIEYANVKNKLESESLIGKNIESIIENIKKENYEAIFIDMCLLKGDYTKLNSKNISSYDYKYMTPIFSMALYNAAKKNNLNAYMYTAYTTIKNYVESWKDTYSLIFQNSPNVDFYNRDGKHITSKKPLYNIVIRDIKKNGKNNCMK